MLRLAELGRRAVDDRARVDQVDGVELVAAVVALVAARLGVAADRARSLDVAVGQRAAGRGGERAERRLLDEVAVLVKRAEEVLGDAVVVPRRRAREAVVRDAEISQVLADERVVAVGGLTRRDAAPVGGHHHRRPVLVGPADHQHVVALQPVIAREDVRRARRSPPRVRCGAGRSRTARRARRGSSALLRHVRARDGRRRATDHTSPPTEAAAPSTAASAAASPTPSGAAGRDAAMGNRWRGATAGRTAAGVLVRSDAPAAGRVASVEPCGPSAGAFGQTAWAHPAGRSAAVGAVRRRGHGRRGPATVSASRSVARCRLRSDERPRDRRHRLAGGSAALGAAGSTSAPAASATTTAWPAAAPRPARLGRRPRAGSTAEPGAAAARPPRRAAAPPREPAALGPARPPRQAREAPPQESAARLPATTGAAPERRAGAGAGRSAGSGAAAGAAKAQGAPRARAGRNRADRRIPARRPRCGRRGERTAARPPASPVAPIAPTTAPSATAAPRATCDRAEMRERDRVAVGGVDRHDVPARRDRPGEASPSPRRARAPVRPRAGDIDAAVLAARVRVA